MPLKGKKAVNGRTPVKKMKGGSSSSPHSDSETSIVLAIAMLAFAGVFAIGFAIAYLVFLDRPSPSPTQTVLSPSQSPPSLPSRQVPVINAPPVYPTKPPEYPLRGQPSQFQQMGVLVAAVDGDKEPILLPLFGRKLSSRDRWEYYCASDKFHMMRLPVVVGSRDCQEDVGCDEIFNGQQVMVPDYGTKPFTARIYKYNTQTY